ncbi:MarR family transcriptional regulator [Kitasatospora sp. NPDC059646]|uniref:MarR family transcriptional regulator n=1 Tax=Kitasatospora sp. NPDC059646 TaxID=3346893 RepID=UPI00369E8526
MTARPTRGGGTDPTADPAPDSPGPEPTREELVAWVAALGNRRHAVWVRYQQALATGLGLGLTDVQCLRSLAQQRGELTTRQIADLTGLTTGSATRLVDRLEQARLVARRRDTADRRLVHVRLTLERRPDVAAAWEQAEQAQAELIASYDDAQLAVIGSYLSRAADIAEGQIEGLLRLTPPVD